MEKKRFLQVHLIYFQPFLVSGIPVKVDFPHLIRGFSILTREASVKNTQGAYGE